MKLHAEQLSNLGGARLAAFCGALSADHLEYLDAEGVAAMAASGTVATVLPGAFYFLREKQAPPIDLLRRAGVPIAVATDCNPGSSPLASPLLAMNMACTLFRLTPEEALAGMTRNAARALGLEGLGAIEPGAIADLAVWDVRHPAELAYRIAGILSSDALEATGNDSHSRPGSVPLSALEAIYRGADARLDPASAEGIARAAAVIGAIAEGDAAVYGVNTGFGKLASVRIPPKDLATLQRNLILSHCCGVGAPLAEPITRLIMALKLMSLGRGASGVRPETVALLGAMLERGVLPVIPEKGSVGASGDLAPLAHMTAVMIGESEAIFEGERMPARAALSRAGLERSYSRRRKGSRSSTERRCRPRSRLPVCSRRIAADALR